MSEQAEGQDILDRELKPCPFCGETVIDYETTVAERAIRCTRCSASIVRDIATVLPEHVWNARATQEIEAGSIRAAIDAKQERREAVREFVAKVRFSADFVLAFSEMFPGESIDREGEDDES